MGENEIVPCESEREVVHISRELHAATAIIASMAEMVRAMNQRITTLEKEIRTMAVVTSAQEKALNAAIMKRARMICDDRSLAEGCIRSMATEIRKDVRGTAGIRTMRDMPQCQYKNWMEYIRMWADAVAIRRVCQLHGCRSTDHFLEGTKKVGV